MCPVKVAAPLLLEWDASMVPEGGSMVMSPMASPVKGMSKEPAGHSFHHKALAMAGHVHSEDDDSSDESEGERVVRAGECDFSTVVDIPDENDDDDDEDDAPKKKKKKGEKEQDHYAVLGLGELRFNATDEDIKYAYRQAALIHHPDKKTSGASEEEMEVVERNFKGIQRAYEVLQDTNKRRLFDSVDKFNEHLPATCKEGKFFSTFGEAFKRNARWSIERPVPDVGDADTPWEEVDAFYDFWFFKFKSWREFPHDDEEDPDQAEGREHRRWIERENNRLRAQAKKEEGKRLKAFVDNAYKADPRVQAKKAEEKAAREAAKAAKAEARYLRENAARIAQEEAAAKAAAEEAASKENAKELKKQREKEKKLVRKERARLRLIAGDAEGEGELMGAEYVETICSGMEDLSVIKGLCDKLEGMSVRGERVSLLQEELKKLDSEAAAEEERLAVRRQEMREEKARKEAEEAAAKKGSETPWSDEEVRMLEKALAKFPKGTPRRWDQVTQYVRTRTMDEVLVMAKEKLGADANVAGARPESNADKFIIQDKKMKNLVSDVEATKRDESFTDVKAPPVVEGQEAGGAAGDWSKAQEVALVKAIKAFPKDTPDRWGRIAEAVPGKAKKECFDKFAALRDAARAAK